MSPDRAELKTTALQVLRGIAPEVEIDTIEPGTPPRAVSTVPSVAPGTPPRRGGPVPTASCASQIERTSGCCSSTSTAGRSSITSSVASMPEAALTPATRCRTSVTSSS